jgi:cytochrome P450
MVARVHQHNHRNYGRGSLSQPFALFLGSGLLTSERETWSVRRRLMAPHFRAGRSAGTVAAVWTETGRLLDGWAARASAGGAFDICPDLERLTFRIVLGSLFGIDLADREDQALRQLTDALVFVSAESFRMYPLPALLTARSRARFAADIRALDGAVTAAIQQRVADGHERGDLLDTLIEADLGPRAARDELLTMLHAGQHTVASSIAFALYLLSRHEDVAQRVHVEVAALHGREPGPDDLPALPYLGQVLQETMRLYPAAWGGVREALDDDRLGGHQVPAGTPIVFSQYVTHRHPEFWPQPEEFRPERFTGDDVRARHRYAYFPFGGGPHLCIGQDMALVELAIVVAMVVQRFRLRPGSGAPVRPKALLDLVPAGGVPLSLAAR